MKNKKFELNVDYVGGQGSLTADEEMALSKYFQEKKRVVKRIDKSKRTKTAKRKLETV